ncbi:hypothetical protein KIS1582_2714 [Cytobacillus firmus]|uniref:Uncharacterized protein n=1 Tax=Cytobacillus firmus TaxID=1399 RepID=A0A800NAB3_CYTFI|nr:hypothetical protein KIS1582_2714 [Cytobacillus firmus]
MFSALIVDNEAENRSDESEIGYYNRRIKRVRSFHCQENDD